MTPLDPPPHLCYPPPEEFLGDQLVVDAVSVQPRVPVVVAVAVVVFDNVAVTTIIVVGVIPGVDVFRHGSGGGNWLLSVRR